MDRDCNEVAARILEVLGVAVEFPLGCCDYEKFCVVVSSFGIAFGSEIAMRVSADVPIRFRYSRICSRLHNKAIADFDNYLRGFLPQCSLFASASSQPHTSNIKDDFNASL